MSGKPSAPPSGRALFFRINDEVNTVRSGSEQTPSLPPRTVWEQLQENVSREGYLTTANFVGCNAGHNVALRVVDDRPALHARTPQQSPKLELLNTASKCGFPQIQILALIDGLIPVPGPRDDFVTPPNSPRTLNMESVFAPNALLCCRDSAKVEAPHTPGVV